MTCKKNCKCKECEMLDEQSFVTIVDDSNSLNQHRISVRAIHCNQYGHYALRDEHKKLKGGGRWKDDLIYTSEEKDVEFNGYQLIIKE